MSARFRTGLVVGKFAPLHRGHQLLIDTAIERCREIALLTYTVPELPGCSAERRAQWLEALYPNAIRLVVTDSLLKHDPIFPVVPRDDAGDATQRAFIAHVLKTYLNRTVDAVFTSESYGEGFAADLTRRQREVDANAGPVQHVLVDAARDRIPISARAIREDVHAHRPWLDPRVYASFVERVAILGGESSGKSTLAAALAAAFDTVHVAEFGRELWERRHGKLEIGDMDLIGCEHVAREHAATLQATRYVFCDTSPLTTLFYSRDLFQCANTELKTLAARHYDHYILCEPDFAFVQDGTRRDANFRQRQHRWYVDELAKRCITPLRVRGSLAERVAQVRAHLSVASALER